MKKYKTWELLKMAEETKNKFNNTVKERPKYKDNNGNVVVFGQNGYGKGLFAQNGFPLKFDLVNTDWEAVEEPVDFLTAVKAYSEGKTIRCEHENRDPVYFVPNKYIKTLVANDGEAVTSIEILEAIWYVEDSNA